jgi:hypothetical protein
MKQASDAIVFDTSHLDVPAAIAKLKSLLAERGLI